ncbi:MAG: elongation factor P [Kiritimatiellae bacterium]|jgi:elongation factor P|nr:elongation factor P [Kiritimatiellia bacterium]
MPKASDLKRGSYLEIDGIPHVVEDLKISTPTARGGTSLYRFRFRNLQTKGKIDKTHKGDDMFKDANFTKKEVQFSYEDQGSYVFMDVEDYSEFSMMIEDIEYEKNFITEDVEGIKALIQDGQILAVELPAVVELEIVRCDPAARGNSATARTKPATLVTGWVVQVPEYMENHEILRVDTRTGEFLSKA